MSPRTHLSETAHLEKGHNESTSNHTTISRVFPQISRSGTQKNALRDTRDVSTDIDLVLSRVSRRFSDLMDDANPLVVALELQDNSSVGLGNNKDEFLELHKDVKNCLRQQVDRNYQAFNASIGVYHTISSGINDAHNGVIKIKEELVTLKRNLEKRRPELRDLQQMSLRYKEMILLLDVAEMLKNTPEKVEELLSQKRFLQAHKVLNDALQAINSRNLLKVPVIQPLHLTIVNQQSTLYGILTDELTAHLYLRSPYTHGRWTAFRPSMDEPTEETNDLENSLKERLRLNSELESAAANIERFVASLSEPLPVLSSESVEEDSLQYIRSLLLTLNRMDGLSMALEQIQLHLKEDLKELVHKTVHDIVKEAGLTAEAVLPLKDTLFAQFASPEYAKQLKVLEALACTLFSKFSAVLEGHRGVAEVVQRLNRSVYDLNAVSAAIESEVRSLFQTYVEGDPLKQGTKRRRANSLQTQPDKSNQTKESIQYYRFSVSAVEDEPKQETLVKEFAELRKSLQRTVPGLVAQDTKGRDLLNPSTNIFAEERAEDRLGLVAPPHVLNIRALLEPAAAFIQRSKTVLQDAEGAVACVRRLDGFLDEYLTKSFLPALRTQLQHTFEDVAESTSALQPDSNYNKLSQLPIVEAAIRFFDMLTQLCRLLNMGAQYREEYATVFVDLLYTVPEFFQKHLRSFTSDARKIMTLVTSVPLATLMPQLRANIISQEAMAGNTSDDATSSVHDSASATHVSPELQVFLNLRHVPNRSNAQDIHLTDLLEMDAFRTLALLSTSAQWITEKLRSLRKPSELQNEAADVRAARTRVRKRWTLLDAAVFAEPGNHEPRALLGGQNLQKFDKIVSELDRTAQLALSVLRADMMCRTVHHFDEMSTKGAYNTDVQREDRDPTIDVLQCVLTNSLHIASEHLTAVDVKFVSTGLSRLMNELFMLESENLNGITSAGVRKMFGNLLSLQQMLKSLIADPREVDFTRAVEFYQILRQPPLRMLDGFRDGTTPLTFQDMRLLLRVRQREDSARAVVQENFIELDELERRQHSHEG